MIILATETGNGPLICINFAQRTGHLKILLFRTFSRLKQNEDTN